MKIQKYSGEEERNILTAAIVSHEVLGRIISGLGSEKKPFQTKWANIVFGWCAEFYAKYNKAPRGHVQSLFQGYAQRQPDDAVVDLIERFLSNLSEDYKTVAKELNVDYLVDLASRTFNRVRYTRLKDSLELALQESDMALVEKSVTTFHPVSFAASSVVDVLTDEAALVDAIAPKEDNVLVEYPGDLGEFFGPHLCRDSFVAFLAPEKRGKSFWLIDMAWRATRSRRRTFFFSVGDMSRNQMLQRFVVRMARRPIGFGSIEVPKRIGRSADNAIRLRTEKRDYPKRIKRSELVAAQREIHQLTAAKESMLKLACSSNSTTKVDDIRMRLDEEIKAGWIPDVVVIDYADILAPETGARGEDFRNQINITWQALRRLSQDYHCLVVTATQSDAKSYDTRVITRSHFSEDKRKLSHVTGMIGINQTEDEKSKGLYRLNWVALREGASNEFRCVTVAGCLGLANPAMKSIW